MCSVFFASGTKLNGFARLFFFSKVRIPEEKGKRRLSECSLLGSPPIFLPLLYISLLVQVLFCPPSRYLASQVRYLVAQPRTLYPKRGCLTWLSHLQCKSLAPLGAFLWLLGTCSSYAVQVSTGLSLCHTVCCASATWCSNKSGCRDQCWLMLQHQHT